MFCFLRTAVRDRPKGSATGNRHQPPTANHCQPPPTANRQPLPTAANHRRSSLRQGVGVVVTDLRWAWATPSFVLAARLPDWLPQTTAGTGAQPMRCGPPSPPLVMTASRALIRPSGEDAMGRSCILDAPPPPWGGGCPQ